MDTISNFLGLFDSGILNAITWVVAFVAPILFASFLKNSIQVFPDLAPEDKSKGAWSIVFYAIIVVVCLIMLASRLLFVAATLLIENSIG